MLDETGFYAPSMAHNTLPSHPWLGISVFHVHNSTVSKQLRYSLSKECTCPMAGRRFMLFVPGFGKTAKIYKYN